MNDFNEIAIFTAVAQEMSVTRAAAVLGISKAAVSRSVTSFEARLGTRLLERNTRRLRLTEAGEACLVHARLAVEEGQQAERSVFRLSDLPRGTLSVVLPVILAQFAVAPQLARFLATYPELALDLQLKGGQNDPIAQHVDVAFQTGSSCEGFAIDSEATVYRVDGSVRELAIPGELRPAPISRRSDNALLSDCKRQRDWQEDLAPQEGQQRIRGKRWGPAFSGRSGRAASAVSRWRGCGGSAHLADHNGGDIWKLDEGAAGLRAAFHRTLRDLSHAPQHDAKVEGLYRFRKKCSAGNPVIRPIFTSAQTLAGPCYWYSVGPRELFLEGNIVLRLEALYEIHGVCKVEGGDGNVVQPTIWDALGRS